MFPVSLFTLCVGITALCVAKQVSLGTEEQTFFSLLRHLLRGNKSLLYTIQARFTERLRVMLCQATYNAEYLL